MAKKAMVSVDGENWHEVVPVENDDVFGNPLNEGEWIEEVIEFSKKNDVNGKEESEYE